MEINRHAVQRTVLITILSMFAAPGYAGTWLCIGEKEAYVSHTKDAVVEAGTTRGDYKLVVSAELGVRHFDTDYYQLNRCYVTDGRPTRCESSRTDRWYGVFLMHENNIFTFISVGFGIKDTSHYIVKGKCSKISD